MTRLGLLAIARQFDYVHERTDLPNRGARVEAIQHWGGGAPGDSWCCEQWWMWHDLHFKGTWNVPRVQAVQDVYELALERHWMIAAADVAAGDTFIYVDDNDHAHHIGVVTAAAPLTGIAGNTSPDGSSSNGDGTHEHALVVPPHHLKCIRIPGVIA